MGSSLFSLPLAPREQEVGHGQSEVQVYVRHSLDTVTGGRASGPLSCLQFGPSLFAPAAHLCYQPLACQAIPSLHCLMCPAGSHTLLLGCALWVFNCTGVPVALRQDGEEAGLIGEGPDSLRFDDEVGPRGSWVQGLSRGACCGPASWGARRKKHAILPLRSTCSAALLLTGASLFRSLCRCPSRGCPLWACPARPGAGPARR